MVATWNIAADATYYSREAESQGRAAYYLDGQGPVGVWHAPAGDFGIADGTPVDPVLFQRLYAGLDVDGNALVTESIKGRIAAYDFVFSAPRSVTLAWAFADPDRKARIEAAQRRAVRAALRLLEREATFARRGHNGAILEPVPLTAALFQHGESRPAEHEDGKVFADPNLHTHAVIPNMATRADGSVGALFSVAHRDLKLAVGAVYHSELSAALIELGFGIDRIGRNGIFEIAGVDDDLIAYFSARRREIEAELKDHSASSTDAGALAAAIAKSTRQAKDTLDASDREVIWRKVAAERGADVAGFLNPLQEHGSAYNIELAEGLLAERLAALPAELTAQRSVFERKDLIAAVASALVGTGLPAARIEPAIAQMVASGTILDIGRGKLDHARYTTPEVLVAEEHLSAVATRLVANGTFAIEPTTIAAFCSEAGLSEEQKKAALAATSTGALAIIAGAPGSGKTTTLSVIAGAYRSVGRRVLGTASAWRVANTLHNELGIEARAIASWREGERHGHAFLKQGDVLVVDEAGLVSLPDMVAMVDRAEQVGAKIVLVGDRKQLQPIGGPALSVLEQAIEATRVEEIVRQHEPWMRNAIRHFGQGRAEEALQAFAAKKRLIEAEGTTATVGAAVQQWNKQRQHGEAPLLLVRTNATSAAISRAVRDVLRQEGVISGPDINFTAVTPSGQTTSLSLAVGDQIRFLQRDDRLGTINGTIARITAVEQSGTTLENIRVEAKIGGQEVAFSLAELSDEKGRVKLGWAYCSTVYQSQGMTVDSAIVLVDEKFDRHQIYVAASRARSTTTLVVDARSIDRNLASELPVGQVSGAEPYAPESRRAWLAKRLSRAGTKESALEVLATAGAQADPQKRETEGPNTRRRHDRSREASLG